MLLSQFMLINARSVTEHIISVLPDNGESSSNKIVKVKRAATIDDVI